jgi:GMP synthase (glutamine-hydrolysing)
MIYNAMKPLLILKMGTSMPHLTERRGDFEDWIVLPLKDQDLSVVVVSPYIGEPLPRPEHFSGIIITGSHAMVTDREDWSEQTAAWIPRVIESGVPLLGICYGHQLMAHAMGGVVGNFPGGVELGTVPVTLTDKADKDPLFNGLPNSIMAHASHTQTVLQLPPDAIPLASNENEPHHAFAIGPCAWGVQFHPEFDADIMKTYVHAFSDLMKSHGQDPDQAVKTITETPHSMQLLNRFIEIAFSGQTIGNP